MDEVVEVVEELEAEVGLLRALEVVELSLQLTVESLLQPSLPY